MSKTVSFWETERLSLPEAVDLTTLALNAYIEDYSHLVICFSGGKDSSTVLTLFLHLIAQGVIKRPETVTVLYSDTRMEIPPLHLIALEMLDQVKDLGCEVKVVEPPIEDRFFVRMLGRGYPPPHNGMRWCTGILKINPMKAAIQEAYEQSGRKLLMLTGMRIGESAARDKRIALACSSKDGECGQGAIVAEAKRAEQADLFGLYEDSDRPAYLFTPTLPGEPGDILSPILPWRVCHVADWLQFEAPALVGFPTHRVLEVYGAGAGDHEPLEARTGCIACPVAGNGDPVLQRVCKLPEWSYLQPLLRLRWVYEELSRGGNRLKKNGERNKDGKLSARPNRGGPLLLDVRRWGLEQVLQIQDKVNKGARQMGRPELVLIDETEEIVIRMLIEARTWPEKWGEDDLLGSDLVDLVVGEGLIQPILPGVIGL